MQARKHDNANTDFLVRSDYELSFWKNRKILVAGGGGFIGSHLVERLVRSGALVRVLSRSIEKARWNLRDCLDRIELIQGDLTRLEDCVRSVRSQDAVFNLAGEVAGIGYNFNRSGITFLSNVSVNMVLLEAARLENVERYECTSSTCVYSREKSLNAQEEDGFVGDPEPTVLGYGWAKRVAELQARFYATDYGIKVAIVRPSNAFGPRDDFSPETSHVIPALIRRVFESSSDITVWGSGRQTRSFVYVDDIVRGIIDATERYAVADPINLGAQEEITIGELVRLIIRLIGKSLRVRFDASKPEGQPRKFADVSKAVEKIGWKAEFTIEDGLEKTISWYKDHAI